MQETHVPALVSPDRLRADSDAVILDATWFPPFAKTEHSGAEAFMAAAIPGARFFDIDAIAAPASGLPHMLPGPSSFSAHMDRLGTGNDSPVVIYDRNGFMASARAWWMLRAMGHENVAVLDGGLTGWRTAGGDISAGKTGTIATQGYTASLRSDLIADADMVSAALTDATVQIVDARPAARFDGDSPEPRANLARGHMPGACNIPHGQLLHSASGRMRSRTELLAIFAQAKLDISSPALIATCGSGVTAAILLLALAAAGRYDGRLYDGSWAEWGGLTGAQIEGNA